MFDARNCRLVIPVLLLLLTAPPARPDEPPIVVITPGAAAVPAGLTREQVEAIVRDYLENQGKEQKPAGLAGPVGDQAAVYEVGKQIDFRAFWQNGLKLETKDRAFRLHLGGLIHTDAGGFEADDAVMFGPGGVGPLNDGAAFRRVRLHVLGAMYETVEWAMELGFENRQPQFFDVYAELPHLPYVGAWRVGHFREPFGMDALTSYNNLTFLERGLIQDPFIPFFNLGTMVYGTWFDEAMSYAAGVFRPDSDSFNGAGFGDGTHAYTGRLTFNPWYDEASGGVLHLGLAGSYRVLPQLNAQGMPVSAGGVRRVVLASRPEIRLGVQNFVTTPVIQADREQLLGAELGLGVGPFLLQAEYSAAFLENALLPGSQRGAPCFHGFYLQASYFLTGEHRPYVRTRGIFGAVRPYENFFWVHTEEEKKLDFGRGAWELAVRYSEIDLSDGSINGGRLRDVTVGLNWYLNPNCRLAWNYLLVWRDVAGSASDGLTQVFAARFQLEF